MRNIHGEQPLFFVPNFKADKHSLNPRTHEGCDKSMINKKISNTFQSTHPFGCD